MKNDLKGFWRGGTRGQFFTLLILGAVCIRIGAFKEPPTNPFDIVRFLFVPDVSTGQMAAVAIHASLLPAASNAVEAASMASGALADSGVVFTLAEELHGLMSQIEGDTRYFGFKMPFSTPENTALNTAVDILKFKQNENDVEAWFWFSTVPGISVNIHISATTEFGETVVLAPTTNEWPNASLVDGVPCYRYEYALPEKLRGVVLFPPQEIIFGSLDGQPFQVPPDGIITTDGGGTAWQPFNGVDTFDDGVGNQLEITYRGGIAVAAKLNGESLK